MKSFTYFFIVPVVSFFAYTPSVLATDTDIVITEIAAYQQSDHEWIEVYNKGTTAVDLTGWKFFESDTNHALSAFRGDLTIDSGEYAVIADNAANTAADYPAYTGTLIDSSWSTLNESGEIVAIKSVAGIAIEQFTYIASTEHSLERKDPLLNDYTSGNWQEHSTGNTIGAKNSNAISLNPPSEVAPTPPLSPIPADPAPVQPEPPQTASSTPATSTSTVPVWQPAPSDVLINEFVSDPDDNEKEWIELYNLSGQSADLTGWTIEDGSKTLTLLTGKIGTQNAERFRVIEGVAGTLNNGGDLMILRNAERVIIDQVAYGSWDDGNILNNAPTAHDPYSVARVLDGANAYNNANDFRVTATPTKGASNIASVPSEQMQKKPIGTIVFSELLANPVSRASVDEYIEIANIGSLPVNLSEWEIVNEQGTRYRIDSNDFSSVVLLPGGFLTIPRSISNIALKNSGGGSVRLYEPDAENPKTRVSYKESAPLGSAYARDANGRYQWTETPTPNSANVIKKTNKAPLIVADLPSKGIIGAALIFDASDTTDPDADEISFEWDFGDATGSRDVVARHSYAKSGAFTVVLTVRDSLHGSTKKWKLTITKQSLEPTQQTGPSAPVAPSSARPLAFPYDPNALRLNEILPNPKGVDRTEFIELKNSSFLPVNLSGYSLRGEKQELWRGISDTILLSGELFVVDSAMLSKQLLNTKDVLSLIAPNGTIPESIDYEDAPEGQSLSKSSAGNWLWSDRPTEGQENAVDYYDSPPSEDEDRETDELASTSEVTTSVRSKKTSSHNARVHLEGVVSAGLGILGKNILYVSGPTNIQVYVSSQHIPKVVPGDRVSISGILSESNGETRIRLDKNSTFTIIRHEKLPDAKRVDIADIGEDVKAALVQVKGDVTQARWPYVTLNDGNDEIQIMFKRSAGFAGMPLREGAHASVSGILQQGAGGYKIVPRDAADIQIDRTTRIDTVSGKQSPASKTRSTVLAGALAVAVIAGGLFIQNMKK